VTIESGTRQVVSSLLDGSGKGRRGDEFKGFERELGFSFPVQDMFCSLSKNDRKKVTASYTPGSFVCNDISYYMENFSRGLRYSQSTLDRLENANESSKSDQLRRLSLRFEEDLKAEEARLLSLKDQKTQAYQKYLLDLQELRARNERRTMAGAPLAELEKEPVFYFNDGDATQSIKRDYDYKLRNVENEFLREQNRIQRFRSLFSLENPIPFVFIHVPVSDGVIHPPVFKLEDAKCLSKSESLPYSSNWQWMEVQEASTRLEESSSSLRSEAADIIRRKLKMAAKATAPGAVPGTPDVGSGRMAECQKDYSREKEVSHTYYDEKAKKEVTVYRSVVAPSRFVYALSSWESKAELKEESERNQYARLILQMVQGAFTARQINARDFPLPTLGKRKYFPRGKENLTKAIKDIERLTKPSVEVQMITQGKAYDPKNMVEGFDYTLLKVPAQLSSDEAACYRSFLEKVISDQDREKDNDAS
jgi:hypothetical protein